jgi:Protein of unknown function (DUF732)
VKAWIATALAGCAVTGLLVGAPTAKADDAAYLTQMSGDWVIHIFGPEAMLAEGHKVCPVLAGGPPSAKAIDMVQADMSVPRFTAVTIVNAAMDTLC